MNHRNGLKLDWHCKDILIYVFPEKELRGLSPNFHIHVAVSNLYIPTFGPPIFLQQNRQTDPRNINRLQKHECRNWDCRRAVPSFPGNICFKIFGIMSLQCRTSITICFIILSFTLTFFSLSIKFYAAK